MFLTRRDLASFVVGLFWCAGSTNFCYFYSMFLTLSLKSCYFYSMFLTRSLKTCYFYNMFLTLSLSTYYFPICFWNYGIQLLLLLGCLCVRARNLWLFRFSQYFMRPISRFCTPGSILWVLEKTPQTNPWPERRANPCERNSITTTGSAFGKGLSIVEGCHLQFGSFSQLLKDALYGLLCSLNY